MRYRWWGRASQRLHNDSFSRDGIRGLIPKCECVHVCLSVCETRKQTSVYGFLCAFAAVLDNVDAIADVPPRRGPPPGTRVQSA